jgi:hypothetical protein
MWFILGGLEWMRRCLYSVFYVNFQSQKLWIAVLFLCSRTGWHCSEIVHQSEESSWWPVIRFLVNSSSYQISSACMWIDQMLLAGKSHLFLQQFSEIIAIIVCFCYGLLLCCHYHNFHYYLLESAYCIT